MNKLRLIIILIIILIVVFLLAVLYIKGVERSDPYLNTHRILTIFYSGIAVGIIFSFTIYPVIEEIYKVLIK